MKERIVIALGGNALLRQGDRGTAAEQAARSLAAMEALAPLLTADRQVVITYGNGPTVGNMLIRQHMAQHVVPPMPLDVCGAESQGNIGYLLERALQQALRQRQLHHPVATLLTMVEVDPRDQAFAHPTKPIGPFLSEQEAEQLARTTPVMRDSDRGFRRVVASPTPRHILELTALETLLDAGVIVIALGGGVCGDEATHRTRSGHRQRPLVQCTGP
jgi:carbamate kinase